MNPPGWLPILERYEPIGLAEMDAATLMNRVDTKFVLALADLPIVLEALAPAYRALEVEGVRLSRYVTLYFDTPAYDLYARHHAEAARSAAPTPGPTRAALGRPPPWAQRLSSWAKRLSS